MCWWFIEIVMVIGGYFGVGFGMVELIIVLYWVFILLYDIGV